MTVTYKKNRVCSTCGCRIADNNKSGYCNRHRDRTGPNNSFWGKTHTKETVAILKVKCKEATRKLWEDDTYRNLVIKNQTGIKRSDEFKETQRKNALKQFQDENQRYIRSLRMLQSWECGALPNNRYNVYSKEEVAFGNDLREILGAAASLLQTNNPLCCDNTWIFPDFIYKNYVIEYNGDHWHANPKKYKATDHIRHDVTAADVWEREKNRNNLLSKLGYTVIVVWSSDYMENKDKILQELKLQLTQDL